MIVLVLLAGALALAAPTPTARLALRAQPKTPRDGPAAQPRAHDIATQIEFYAACLDAGLPTAAAATAVSQIATPATRAHWSHVAALLTLGVPAQAAWVGVEHIPGLEELARIARHSESTGAAVAAAARRIATRLRDTALDDATARAERASVLVAIPLTTCFLPAFLVLGLAPVIISLASTLT